MKQIQIDELHFELMIDENQIQKRIRLIGVDINHRYEDKNPVFIGVLNGCFMFMSDLLKQVVIPCEMSFVKLSSYQGTNQGEMSELIGLGIDLKGRDVIIVEDIVESGNSLKHTIASIEKQSPSSVVVCTLLLKPECLQNDFENIQYVGFEIEKEFVVGYGMDYNGLGRNIPHIYKNIVI
ncbi:MULTISPECIES: hypoxanthine phosphoribosyltransferase [Sphingobacterium]|jgi:hypoxanthine phosphoribosyltransferase|uniref:Hypoxanthine phosphoribosyltransferase n=1 Tax=Sphingobacterium kitahiroshimense TaxID=470446 RepID=A0ABV0BPZ5_9SPHI|nr:MULTISPECIES: hypoxanthine phosphoribosyltransferase [Sphingobacterium]KKX47878.1 hypoxanthine phosphoribosyltransferase [Sphingobacterium sp. IITKGP-BTPF85]MCW2262383.1 hypoxanthine phosphoribosyltransferase [Sphingobacterium kitahiroshimense]NJI74720.1 hypoxanthine phosphoribosyltransferase [Sphingobacterium sp. B16(2022)]TCR12869.1 hypoxanthine phosphoribosyltransferase [Sphingobacterium sp. JUb78]